MRDIYLKAEIKAHYIAGETYSEIAKVLKISRSQCAGYIYRMKDELPPRERVPGRGQDHKPRKPREFKAKALRPAPIVVHRDPLRVKFKPYVKKHQLTRQELYADLRQAVLNTK